MKKLNLKVIREKKKISPVQLAAATGLSFSSITNLEKKEGKINPRASTLIKLAAALGVSIDELFSNTGLNFQRENAVEKSEQLQSGGSAQELADLRECVAVLSTKVAAVIEQFHNRDKPSDETAKK